MKYIQKRLTKESRRCYSCEEIGKQMYDWYSLYGGEFLGVICNKCARRELGPKNKRLKEIL